MRIGKATATAVIKIHDLRYAGRAIRESLGECCIGVRNIDEHVGGRRFPFTAAIREHNRAAIDACLAVCGGTVIVVVSCVSLASNTSLMNAINAFASSSIRYGITA